MLHTLEVDHHIPIILRGVVVYSNNALSFLPPSCLNVKIPAVREVKKEVRCQMKKINKEKGGIRRIRF